MNYKVSVIVPVYNTAPWLRRCLDSICAQSYANLEILCVNDGSTDNSAEILAEYAARDVRVRIFTQTNAGLSAARNTALQHATGEWITGVDSDDYLYPDIYEKAISCCTDEVDMVFFGVKEETEDGKPLPQSRYFDLPAPGVYSMPPELAIKLNVCFWSKLWRRSLLEENNLRFPVGLVHEDEALLWCAAPYVRSIATCPNIGYVYVQRTGAITKTNGLNTLQRVQRRMLILEFIHTEYVKRGFLQTNAQAYLNTLFVCSCCSIPTQNYSELHQLVTSVIDKCGMKHTNYKLERLYPKERWGLLSIRRYNRLKLYTIGGIPIWFKYHTVHGNEINISRIFLHIKKLLATLFQNRR